MNLDEIRLQIDAVDSEIVRLFEERMEIVSKVAEYKIANNKPVFDSAREEVKLNKVIELTVKDENKAGTKELFELLMKLSREKQQKIIDNN